MKNPELFHKTVGILVNAYLNDTLQHQYCAKCAVGNLVAANMGYEILKDASHLFNGNISAAWTECSYNGSPLELNFNKLSKLAKQQIKSTGYSPYEIHLIEKAFEDVLKVDGRFDNKWYYEENADHWQYDGLMSVVDTLIGIHEGNDTEKSEAKSLFEKELTTSVD